MLFSRQGFHETSVSEIAKKAKVNEATIFRQYNNKKELFLEVVKNNASTDDNDLINLQLSLTMEDIRHDLDLIVREYVKIFYEKIHVIRIFVAGIIQFEEFREFGYLVIPALEKHFSEYLNEMEARRIIKVKDIPIVTDLFMSTILSDVTQWTTFNKIESYNQNVEDLIDLKWKKRIDFFTQNLIVYNE